MNRPDLEPEGFQPELLEYFTSFELGRMAVKLTRFSNAGNVGEMVRRTVKGEDQQTRYFYVVSAIQQLSKANWTLENIEGAHIWSTPSPNTYHTELIPRLETTILNKNPNFRVILADERKELVGFFRKNVEELPELTSTWFNLPHPLQEFFDMSRKDSEDVAKEIAARIRLGEGLPIAYNPIDLKNLQGGIKEFVESLRKLGEHPENVSPFKQIVKINNKTLQGEKEFREESTSLEAVHYWGFRTRAEVVGFQLERGGLRFPSRLRDLASLSTAADLMRAEITYGQLSGRAAIAECFNYAGMDLLARRTAEKIMGQPVEIVYGDTLKPTPRYSIPRILEIAFIQRRITTAVQHLL